MKKHSDLTIYSDKKLRTLRNNLNNRLEVLKLGKEKSLPPSHMLHGLDESDCKKLLDETYAEMKRRAKA